MEYPKINSLYKRQEFSLDRSKKAGVILEGNYCCPEIEMFTDKKCWRVSEKIDGMNIRIYYKEELDGKKTVLFQGRTGNSMLPQALVQHLQETFTIDKLSETFSIPYVASVESPLRVIELFGEGYGCGIQSGGYYRKDMGFILFDIKIHKWWLTQDAVISIANKLGIPHAPDLGLMTIDEIVQFVKSKPKALQSPSCDHISEGIIARLEPMMMFRHGLPIMFKLKCVDFK